MPDGRVIEFPDSMSQEQIEAALRADSSNASATSASAAPAQMTGATRLPALVATNELEGLERGLGAPGDLLHAGLNLLPSGARSVVNSVLPYAPLLTHIPLNLPTSQSLLTASGHAGLTQRPDLTPGWDPNSLLGPDAERVLAAGSRGFGSALPAAVVGPEEAVAPSLLSGTTGGAAEELYRNAHPGSTWGASLTGALVGAATGNVANVATRATRAANSIFGPVGQEFDTSGLPWRSAGLTTGKASTRNQLGQFVPVEATHGDIQRSVENIASGLGGSTTLQEAGTYAQAQAQDWLKTTMPAKEVLAWAPVDRAIPAGTPVTLSSLTGTLRSLTQKGGNLAGAIQLLQPRLPAQILKTLQNRASSLSGAPDSWADARALRTAIGAAMADPSIAPKAGAQNLSAMYSAITQDLSRAAKAQGAEDLFAAANGESSRLHDFAENLVGKIVNSKSDRGDPLPEKIASQFLNPTALRRGGSDLENLNSEMPDVTKELAAAHLTGAVNPKGASPPTVGANLVKTWSTMSPQAQRALVTDPRIRARLDSLSGVATRLGALPTKSGSGSNAGLGATTAAGLAAAGSGLLHWLAPEHAPGLQTMLEAMGGASSLGAAGGLAKNSLLSGLANSPTLARYAASLPPGWVLPPSVTGSLGAWSGEQGGNGLEAGH